MRTTLLALLLIIVVPAGDLLASQLDDPVLLARAAAAVRASPQFGIFDDINIELRGRTVTLTGRVTAPNKVKDIGERVARVDGIDQVVNDIKVLPASPLDADLRVRIARAIYSHSTFWHYASMANPPIHIIVEHGRVTLTGAVNSEVERMLAYALAQVDGAFSVTNRLRLDGR